MTVESSRVRSVVSGPTRVKVDGARGRRGEADGGRGGQKEV